MKIVHLADLHLGVELGPIDNKTRLNGRVLDFMDALDAVIDYAENNKADLFIIAGDVFHKHSPNPTYLTMFAERLARLSSICYTVILVGNHDISGSIEKASSVDVFGAINMPNVLIGREYELYDLGGVQLATVPYPAKSRLVKSGEASGDDAIKLRKSRLSDIIKRLGEKAVKNDKPAVLTAHASVEGAIYGVERLMAFGDDAIIDLDDLVYPWDYVALGHIHYRQNLTDGTDFPPVIYPGSLERIDFGEWKDKKGFYWIEIDNDNMLYEFVEIDARPMKVITVDVSGTRHPTEKVLKILDNKDLTGALVKLTVKGVSKVSLRLDDVNAALDKSGAYYYVPVVVNRLVEYSERLEGLRITTR